MIAVPTQTATDLCNAGNDSGRQHSILFQGAKEQGRKELTTAIEDKNLQISPGRQDYFNFVVQYPEQ